MDSCFCLQICARLELIRSAVEMIEWSVIDKLLYVSKTVFIHSTSSLNKYGHTLTFTEKFRHC